jgi:hypothetical protein
MADYIAVKENSDYYLQHHYNHSKLIQITEGTAKLIYNGYLILTDNPFESNGFIVVTYNSDMEYIDNLPHLEKFLLSFEIKFQSFIKSCRALP